MTGAELKEYVYSSGVKRAELAEAIGMTPRGLAYIFAGESVEKRTEIAIRHVIECRETSDVE